MVCWDRHPQRRILHVEVPRYSSTLVVVTVVTVIMMNVVRRVRHDIRGLLPGAAGALPGGAAAGPGLGGGVPGPGLAPGPGRRPHLRHEGGPPAAQLPPLPPPRGHPQCGHQENR